MGLDVYLEDLAQTAEVNAHYPIEGSWIIHEARPENPLTDEQIEENRQAYLKANQEIEDRWKSHKFPEHGPSDRHYLRSSYNGAGFNSVVENLIGKSMYDIFEPPEDYEWCPTKEQLEAYLERAKELTTDLEKIDVPMNATTINSLPVNEKTAELMPKDDREALALYNEKIAKTPFDGRWSEAAGDFFPSGFEVHALIPGLDILKKPCVYVIFKMEIDYYIEQSYVIQEFIETAMLMEKPKISWSG